MKQNLKTNPDYWIKSGNNKTPVSLRSSFQKYFDLYLPKREDWNVIEVGACPGNNLAAIAKSHNYNPFAIDYLPAIRDLPKFFSSHNLKKLTIFEADFLHWDSPILFDVTMSYGFIEHFENWEDILFKHWQITKLGGYLIIGVPILSPAQMLLRRLVYSEEKMQELLSTHNINAMNLKNLLSTLKKFEDSEIVFADYIMQMHNWIPADAHYLKKKSKHILYIWHQLSKFPRKLNWSSSFFSPYTLIVSRKIVTN